MVRTTIGAAVFLLLCVGATRVDAQGVASSFDQLTVLVKAGDTISIVDMTGREAEGRIGKLSRDGLILLTEAGPRQLDERDVVRVRQRRQVIYEKPGGVCQTSISPLFLDGRRGLAVSVKF